MTKEGMQIRTRFDGVKAVANTLYVPLEIDQFASRKSYLKKRGFRSKSAALLAMLEYGFEAVESQVGFPELSPKEKAVIEEKMNKSEMAYWRKRIAKEDEEKRKKATAQKNPDSAL